VRASSEAIRGMRALAGRYRLETLLAIVRDLSELLSNLRWAPDPRTLFEITLIRIMQTARTESDGTPPPEPRETSTPPRAIPATPVAATAVNPAPPASISQVDASAKPEAVNPEPPAPIPQDNATPAPPETEDLPGVWDEDSFDPSQEYPDSQQEGDDTDLEDLPEVSSPVSLPEPERSAPITVPDIAPDLPAHPADTAVPSADTAAHPAGEAAYSADILHQAWEDMLTTLCNSGQMVLYLYLRPARVSFEGGVVTVFFTPEESANQAEVTRKGNDTIIKEALAASAGGPVELVIRTDVSASGPPAVQTTWKDAEWVRKVRRSADDLGIPFTYNE